ncbi:MAG: hypothetical protein H7338_21060 [Candidatus Sericytochromatia bacterium]|nr:hypothetical protein [Candidatus Sericytochromatia bacterium]
MALTKWLGTPIAKEATGPRPDQHPMRDLIDFERTCNACQSSAVLIVSARFSLDPVTGQPAYRDGAGCLECRSQTICDWTPERHFVPEPRLDG